MSIHKQVFDGQELKIIDIPEILPPDGIIRDSVLDLKKPNLLYILGGFEAEDNVPCDVEEFKRSLPRERPLLKAFLDKMEAFTDTTAHFSILTQGYKLITLSNARSIHSLVGYWPMEQEPEVHLVSHPTLEGCMQEYAYMNADPKHHFSDHAMQIMMKTLGSYLGQDIYCKKNTEGKWEVTGEKIPLSSILQATSNLTVMGNSFGSLFIAQYENALKYTLHALHYKPVEIRKIMESVRAFSLGTVSPFSILRDTRAKPDPRFTMIAIEGVNDAVAGIVNPHRAKITKEEVRRCIPLKEQKAFLDALRTHQEQEENSLRDPTHPFPASSDPAEQPEALPNRRFFILRKIAPNRLLIITAVPTYAERWLFEATGAQTEGILAELQKLAVAIMPRDYSFDSPAPRRSGSMMPHIQLGSVIRLGGTPTEEKLLKLLGEITPENTEETRRLLKHVIDRRNEFDAYLRKIQGDRAGHSIIFYLWPVHPLSHLCRRIAFNALGDTCREKGVTAMLDRIDPGGDLMKTLFDLELDSLIGPQVVKLKGHSRGAEETER